MWTDEHIRAESFSDNLDDDVLEISSEAELGLLSYLYNNWTDEGYIGDALKGKTVRLTADLDLSDYQWLPIGEECSLITFDGAGHTIEGLKCSTPEGIGRVGLFQTLYKCVVKDLTLLSPMLDVIRDGAYAGALAGVAEGCYIYDVTVQSPNIDVRYEEYIIDSGVGGLVGKAVDAENDGVFHPAWQDTATVINGVDVLGGSISASITDRAPAFDEDLWIFIGGVAGIVTKSGVTSCAVIGTTISGDDDFAAFNTYPTNLSVGGIAGYTSATYDALDFCLLNNLFAGTLDISADDLDSASVSADDTWGPEPYGVVSGDAVGGICGTVFNDNVLNNLYIGDDTDKIFGVLADETEGGDDIYKGDNDNHNYRYDTVSAAIADDIYEKLTGTGTGDSFAMAKLVTVGHRGDDADVADAIANTKYRGWLVSENGISLGWWNINAAELSGWRDGGTISLTAPSGLGKVNTAASAGTGYWQIWDADSASWSSFTDTTASKASHDGKILRYALPYAYDSDKVGYSNELTISFSSGSGYDSSGPPSDKTIEVSEVEVELFAGNEALVTAEANVQNAFSSSVEVRLVDDTGARDAFYGLLGTDTELYPFDISLYIKGTNTKTQPKDGYKVTFTLPLPEALKDMRESLHVAYIANGKLIVLDSELKQIDGVWCIVFETDHFSPYALIAGEVPEQPEHPFVDIDGHWAFEDICYMAENGLMTGTSPILFSPELPINRGMIVTVLWRMAGEPKTAEDMPFADVKPGEYYYDAVAWAARHEIILGYDAERYGPEDSLTREQLAAILWRYAQYKNADVSIGESTNILSFSDALDVSEYAVLALQWACGEGIITGKPGGILDPGGSAARAEVAAMLHRFLELGK